MKGTILVADDDRSIRTVLDQALGRAGYDVRSTGHAATLWHWVEEAQGDLVITDVVMPDENGLDLLPRIKRLRPDLPIIVMSAQNTLMTAVKATERGAYEYLPKPFDLKELLQVVHRALSAPHRRSAVEESGPAQPDEEEHLPLIGRSAAMQEIYRVLARLMGTDLTVMISGESGTGKELVARALHEYGQRRSGPFVAINMAAIPRELIESELFGHEKGAFTGASARATGRFEQAEAGTLFLDEIGELKPDIQVKLLRALQESEIDPIGASRPVKVDIRLISATNRNLMEQVAQGNFREDLFYRLNVFPIHVPPLRERREDIPPLVEHFTASFAVAERKTVTGIADEAMRLLAAFDWPGNVRQLENTIFRAVVLCDGPVLQAADFPQIVQSAGTMPAAAAAPPPAQQAPGLPEQIAPQAAPPPQPVPAPAPVPGPESWTGNAAAAVPGGVHHFAAAQQEADAAAAGANGGSISALDRQGEVRSLEDVEADLIRLALRKYDGQMSEVARRLGIGRSTLYRKVRSLEGLEGV